ncbi:MAG: hypothetical protein LBH42_08520 [Treponema sp.]|jgi:hypothetical protein|nr:hypothetical protein [Treponema sp.]
MKVPPKILEQVENSTLGLQHGIVSLAIHLRDGQPRYKICREESFHDRDKHSTKDDFCVKADF